MENKTFIRKDGWIESEVEDYEKLTNDDDRRAFMRRNGYDPKYENDAKRLFPDLS